jgi:hypothetical protein
MMAAVTVEEGLVVAALVVVEVALVGSEEVVEISTVLVAGVLAAAVQSGIGEKTLRHPSYTTQFRVDCTCVYQELDSRFRENDTPAHLLVRHARAGGHPGSCMMFGKYT